jgi:hypothetical protein
MPLVITVPEFELFNEETCEFFSVKETKLKLEHSLVSISKWEAKWEKPFLNGISDGEETIDYIRCMTLMQNVDPNVYLVLPQIQSAMDAINEYIDKPMTATTIRERGKRGGRNRIVTSELVYYWMITYGIPTEFQKWHFNRLMMLIRVCQAEGEPPKKMSQKEIMQENAAINAARKAKYHTRG